MVVSVRATVSPPAAMMENASWPMRSAVFSEEARLDSRI